MDEQAIETRVENALIASVRTRLTGIFHTEKDKDRDTDDQSGMAERFRRATRGMDKPQSPKTRKPLQGITNDEIEERTLAVRQLMLLGLSQSQMIYFLPCWGFDLKRSQVSEYVQRIRPTLTRADVRRFERTENAAEDHDALSRWCVIRCCRDAHDNGYKIGRDMQFNAPPMDGMRFRPDGWFWIGRYLFYAETQLEPLPEVRWTQKVDRYIDLWEKSDRFFKVLFWVKHGDLYRIRTHFRNRLKRRGHENLDLFRFMATSNLKSTVQNFATDEVWQTCRIRSDMVSLVKFMRRLDDHPSRNASD
jgi:hypothetical protein